MRMKFEWVSQISECGMGISFSRKVGMKMRNENEKWIEIYTISEN